MHPSTFRLLTFYCLLSFFFRHVSRRPTKPGRRLSRNHSFPSSHFTSLPCRTFRPSHFPSPFLTLSKWESLIQRLIYLPHFPSDAHRVPISESTLHLPANPVCRAAPARHLSAGPSILCLAWIAVLFYYSIQISTRNGQTRIFIKAQHLSSLGSIF